MSDLQSVNAAVEAGADAVGFVMVPGSRRYIGPDLARELAAAIPEGTWKVGVFRDQDYHEIAAVMRHSGLDTVQLHDYGDLDLCRRLQDMGWRVIRAFGLRPQAPSPRGTRSIAISEVESLAAPRAGLAAKPVAALRAGSGAEPAAMPGTSSGAESPLPPRAGLTDANPGEEDLRPFACADVTILLDAWQPGGGGGLGVTTDWCRARELMDRLPGARVILAGGLNPENLPDAIKAVRPWGVDASSGLEKCGRKDPSLIKDFVSVCKVRDCDRNVRKV